MEEVVSDDVFTGSGDRRLSLQKSEFEKRLFEEEGRPVEGPQFLIRPVLFEVDVVVGGLGVLERGGLLWCEGRTCM